MNKRNVEVMVGLFVLLGMLGLVFLSLKAANLSGDGNGAHYSVTARFDNIGGLKVRAPVRTAGVTIGRVSAITLDPKTYQGVVKIEIQNGVEFPKDTSAKILTSGLLGDQYVGLEAGADDKNLASGDVIKQTQSAVVLENLIGQFLNSKAADLGSTASTPTPATAGPK